MEVAGARKKKAWKDRRKCRLVLFLFLTFALLFVVIFAERFCPKSEAKRS